MLGIFQCFFFILYVAISERIFLVLKSVMVLWLLCAMWSFWLSCFLDINDNPIIAVYVLMLVLFAFVSSKM